MTILSTVIMRRTVRLALSVLVGVSLTLPLGAVFAVQRSLDLAAYEFANYATFATVALGPEDLARPRKDFGSEVFLSATWSLPLRSGSNVVDVLGKATLTPSAAEYGWLPSTTRRAYTPVRTGWVDMSMSAAQALDVQPGDRVEVGISRASWIPMVVRGIHDVRLEGRDLVAVFDLAGMASSLPAPDAAFQSELLATQDVDQVALMISSPFYEERLRAAGYEQVDEPIARKTMVESQQETSTNGLGLVFVTALLAGVAGLAFIGREIYVFVVRARQDLLPVMALGIADRRVDRIIALSGSIALLLAVPIGGATGILPYRLGWLAPSLPVYWRLPWVAMVAMLTAVAIILLMAGIRVRRKKDA